MSQDRELSVLWRFLLKFLGFAKAGQGVIMEVLFSISLALVAGLLVSRLVKPLKLPAVTGYLIAGILIGPYCLGRINLPEGVDVIGMLHSTQGIEALGIISKVALGFIAFAIGTEFEMKNLRKIGKQATVIGILQALVTTLVVDAALIGLHFILGEDKFPMSTAIILGAIASATAPAATLMVVKQYKAKGPLTNILLPVVALDDAVGLVVFAISFGVARAMQTGDVDIISMVVNPLIEVVGSLILGGLMGLLFTWVRTTSNPTPSVCVCPSPSCLWPYRCLCLSSRSVGYILASPRFLSA